MENLKEAEQKLSVYEGGYSGEFLSAQDFYMALSDRILKLENGDLTVIDELWLWFAPTCAWDDFVGDVSLGSTIFDKLDKINNEKANNTRLGRS